MKIVERSYHVPYCTTRHHLSLIKRWDDFSKGMVPTFADTISAVNRFGLARRPARSLIIVSRNRKNLQQKKVWLTEIIG
jgi:hypothetical protein